MKGEIIIIKKQDSTSWEDITSLLHDAFAEHLCKGLNYEAATQDVETTRKRVGNGICLVAYSNDVLVGTATIRFRKNLYRKKYSYLMQVGVSSNCKSKGIGTALLNKCIEITKDQSIEYLIVDTSIKAETIINWYLHNGWKKVRLISHRGTKYYSVKMRYAIGENKQISWMINLRYHFSVLVCKIIFREDGKYRILDSLFLRMYMELNKFYHYLFS